MAKSGSKIAAVPVDGWTQMVVYRKDLFEKTVKGLKFIRKLDGFQESSRVMQEDQNGDIWMTHGYKGVYKIQLNKNLSSQVQVKESKNGIKKWTQTSY